ncbi:PP2C family protein-serine/threonine phosphatase [Amycolatopsis cihanbeyliensis]|uniref:Protein phosphatase n=1 Tax=Amycolatopsis cihanbeyliensis TaxID=1128664 RepID=A0A542DRI9_AMYCI|nr:protein phosphatase 2C domain-containing protein [Amycolatopsis cihanbeyliensis]TQJ05729.1 protein phosphatase [Amycolatopsis cihanbeyliensis]
MTYDTGLALRYAVRSDAGVRRKANEDAAFAGERVFAVADGIGGHVYGEIASSTATAAMADLDSGLTRALAAGRATGGLRDLDSLAVLGTGVTDAAGRLVELVARDSRLQGMGTTLTAMLWDGARFAVAHVGDSRCYLLREGALRRLSTDHTLVQALLDGGKMSAEQAAAHPRRSVLMRALQGENSAVSAEPDLFLQEALAGDRYLLCSDGLTDVVSEESVADTLRARPEPEAAAGALIELANAGGGPDNITCVLVDVVGTRD